MRYVCWKSHVQNNSLSYVSTLSKDLVSWEDKVTGTRFFISKKEYLTNYQYISNRAIEKSPSEIVSLFDQNKFYNSFPYFTESWDGCCTLRDASRMFVLFAYLYEQNNTFDRDDFRYQAYKCFFTKDTGRFEKAWNALNVLLHGKGKLLDDISVKVLKGSVYKIKKYFMENNELKDMRGASTLLTDIGENIIPNEIKKHYIDECIIYSGGGNLFCLLPANADKQFPYKLEKIYTRYTLSAQSAFCMVDKPLSSLLLQYTETMRNIEKEIEERKKLKIYNDHFPVSSFYEKDKGVLKLSVDNISLDAVRIPRPVKCELCKVREAVYALKTSNGEVVCGSCLHKHMVGKWMKRGYIEKYKKFTGELRMKPPESLSDIKDKNDYVAVVYGDGNNMGAIIQNIKSITEMMYFSRTIRNASETATFKALKNCCNGKFEIVAVGGDDIFVIVSGIDSIFFGINLIEAFNEEFRNLSIDDDGENRNQATLSIGIGIAKYKYPVRLMLKYAEEAMDRAKTTAKCRRNEGRDDGSLDVVVLEGMEEESKEIRDRKFSLFPYSLKQAKEMLSLVKSLKKGAPKSALYDMKQVFETVGSDIEAKLYYCYHQARQKNKMEKVFRSHTIEGYTWNSGYFYNKDLANYSPWRDILDIWDFCGGDDNGIGYA